MIHDFNVLFTADNKIKKNNFAITHRFLKIKKKRFLDMPTAR
jgi:hypothetical protein